MFRACRLPSPRSLFVWPLFVWPLFVSLCASVCAWVCVFSSTSRTRESEMNKDNENEMNKDNMAGEPGPDHARGNAVLLGRVARGFAGARGSPGCQGQDPSQGMYICLSLQKAPYTNVTPDTEYTRAYTHTHTHMLQVLNCKGMNHSIKLRVEDMAKVRV